MIFVIYSKKVMYNMLQGFGDKLLSEVRKLAPKDIKIRVSTKTFYYHVCSVTQEINLNLN